MAKPKRFFNDVCSLEGCSQPAKYLGLCGKHYKRRWRHGSPEKTLINMNGGVCIVDGCFRPRHSSAGYCKMHDLRVTRHGRTYRIKAPDGSGATNAAGYRLLTIGGRRVYEHIFLAEKALGKPLPPGAVVHHMNSIPDDNYTPFNLVICPSQDYHLLLHRNEAAWKLMRRDAEELKRDE
jgi:hypothetical protein